MKSFRTALESGKPQLGLCIMYPSPGVVERIGADWDWIWIDGQHGQIGYQETLALVRACDSVQRPSFARVPGHEFGSIGLALDTGATGVIVPVVDTPEQAKAVVHAAKFPPLGGRSYGSRRLCDMQGRMYCHEANQETLLVCQIESPEAIENAGRIAEIPGVDALFLGPDDVMLRRGFRMDTVRTKENIGADMAAVAKACQDNGKFSVSVAGNPETMKLMLELGFNMIVCGGDVLFLANTSKTVSTEARKLIDGLPSAGGAEPVKNSSIY